MRIVVDTNVFVGAVLNRLIDDMATLMLAEHDAETRFRLRAARGAGQEARGLKLLAKAAMLPEGAISAPLSPPAAESCPAAGP